MNSTSNPAPSPEQIASYHEHGFLQVSGVFSPEETAGLDATAARLLQRTDLMDTDYIRFRWQNCVTTGECRFDCFDPVIDLSPVCERVAHDSRLIGLVSALKTGLDAARFLLLP